MDSETIQRLLLLKTSVRAMKARIVQDLDGMVSEIDRILPPEARISTRGFVPDWRAHVKKWKRLKA